MLMKEFNIDTVVKRYNALMVDDIRCFENPAAFDKENETELECLKGIISEARYVLATYYEEGHDNYEIKFSDDESERKQRISEIGKIKRFIAKYEPYIELLSEG